MIRPLLLAALLLSATQAAALTCVPPDPLQSFRMAAESPESYVVLRGRLAFDPATLPQTLPDPGAAETALPPVEARFEGFALDSDGFTRPTNGPVLLSVQCLGQFCGSIGAGEDWLLFARQGEGTLTVDVHPCGSWAFDRIPEGAEETMAACLRGEACAIP